MNFGLRRLRCFVWDSTRGVREKILARLRAHVARAFAENFGQLIEGLQRTGTDLAAEIRAAELRHCEAQARAEASLQAAEERFREFITRYEQKVGDYHQSVSESNLLAEGVIREMVRLQQQVDELSEAVDVVHDAIQPEITAPVTLKYRAAA